MGNGTSTLDPPEEFEEFEEFEATLEKMREIRELYHGKEQELRNRLRQKRKRLFDERFLHLAKNYLHDQRLRSEKKTPNVPYQHHQARGADLAKMIGALEVYFLNPTGTPGELTCALQKMAPVNALAVGQAYAEEGMDAAIAKIRSQRPGPFDKWSQFVASLFQAPTSDHPQLKGFGYAFNNSSNFRAIEAPWSNRDFQRKEFLGDAVLGFLSGEICRDKYQNAYPPALTEFCRIIVSNNTLTMIAMCKGLNEHLESTRDPKYQELLAEIRDRWEDLTSTRGYSWENDGYFWVEEDFPKAPADELECVVGAVFLDTGLNLETTKNFVKEQIVSAVDKNLFFFFRKLLGDEN
ncbi:Dicer-like protein 1 [Gryganskiella cystojenkinii]|nr:Dicer-like protein 1 [Gryganskiella cystojenkinii]